MIPLEKYRDEKSWGWYRMVPDAWQRWVASAHPRRVLEIGAFDGVSANVMLEAIFTHPESTVDTVDPYLPDPTTPQVAQSTRALFEENRRRGGHGDRVRLHQGRSLETLARMITDGLSESFDVIFIDGSHLAADVMTDAALAWPLLAPGGILIFDDYEWGRDRPPHQRPREAIDAFESAYVESLVPVWRGYQRIYRKTGVPGGLRLLSGNIARQTCAIIGTYDSGSSLLSSIFECLGFEIGRPGWCDFFESASLRQMLLGAFDELKMAPEPAAAGLVGQLRRWQVEAARHGPAIAAKHPLLGLCLPELVEAWGTELRFIRALRPLEDSIRGLTRRGWFPEPEKMQRILQREIEGFFQTGHPFVGVNYEKVLTAPEFEIERLADELGIKVTESSIEWASAVVNRWDGRT
jgi:predicted O-methyltransferase YrrM